MNIVVCIKQVPDTTEIKIDPIKNTLIRTGVPSIMNPFDKNALETGLSLKDRYGGKVTVISMGPPQAKAVLREALAMGADEAYLVTTLPATSYPRQSRNWALTMSSWAASRQSTEIPARPHRVSQSIWAQLV